MYIYIVESSSVNNNIIFQILQKCFQNVQLFSINPIKSLKGYLRYKTITSQNMSYETQVKNFFIS